MLKTRFKEDMRIEAGVDEAGRGCLWGPLFAATVIWPPEEEWLEEHREFAPQIKDSKKLSAKKRERLAEAIQALAIDFGIGSVSAEEIDSGGMSYANRLAFTRALDTLTVTPDRVLIDGILPLWPNQLTERQIQEQETIPEGDAQYIPIAAASILAKTTRDSIVAEWVAKDPTLETNYSIGSSKGYGTEKHRRGILEHGKHREHRNLFLRKLLGQVTTQDDDCLITDS
jgi:ribonuclease HII